MIKPDYWRQLDLVSSEQLDFPITLIGAGGIGSPLALALAKMGCPRLALYDPDTVEAHNLPNQIYRLNDVGRPKVAALADLLREFAPLELDVRQERVSEQALRGVVISAVDSMASRQDIWHGCVRYKPAVPLYVDARMGAEVCRVFTVNPADPDDVTAYEATLHGDGDAAEDPCTAQAIIYNTFAVAALVANQVKRHACDEALERDVILDFATLTLLTGAQL
ncbi:MAG TPA: ThiF family adenylyltransferase [Chloroflexota bacterium]